MLKAALFDAYETLVEVTCYASPYSHFYAELGLSAAEVQRAEHLLLTHATDTLEDAARLLQRAFGRAPVRPHVIERAQQELDEHLASCRPMDGLVGVISQVRDLGLRLALCSNASTPYKAPIRELGIARLLDQLVFSCDVGHAKPESEIFRIALERVGAAPHEAVMIGDNDEADIEGAQAVGMHTIHVDGQGLEGVPLCDVPREIDRLMRHRSRSGGSSGEGSLRTGSR
ncbi:MAG: HAD family hydrolase [Planctomycetota bacterium]